MRYSVPLLVLLLVLIAAGPAGGASIDIYSDLQGWVNSAGTGNGGSSLNDTFTGNGSDGLRYNSWASFDLSSLSGTVTSAMLRLDVSGTADYTVGLYDVNTPLSDFLDGTSGLSGYNDLGGNALYGDVWGRGLWTIPALSTQAVTDINAALGGTFLIGFTNLTLNLVPPDGVALGTSINGAPGDDFRTPLLKLEIVPEAVPEPGSLVLLGTGLGLVGLAAWRKRK